MCSVSICIRWEQNKRTYIYSLHRKATEKTLWNESNKKEENGYPRGNTFVVLQKGYITERSDSPITTKKTRDTRDARIKTECRLTCLPAHMLNQLFSGKTAHVSFLTVFMCIWAWTLNNQQMNSEHEHSSTSLKDLHVAHTIYICT